MPKQRDQPLVGGQLCVTVDYVTVTVIYIMKLLELHALHQGHGHGHDHEPAPA